MNLELLIFFILSTIGMTHIIVDGSILQWFRTLVKSVFNNSSQWLVDKTKLSFFSHLATFGSVVDCYLCCGTWCGFFMGWVWVSTCPFKIFACGCAGAFLAQFAAILLNWIEASTIVNLPQGDNHGN